LNVFFLGEFRIMQLVGLEVAMVGKDAVSKDLMKQVLGNGLTTAS
jgi:uncharacterized membrane protein YcjF (UPF0283 family)